MLLTNKKIHNDYRSKRLNQLRTAYNKQPYTVELDGFRITVDKGVFPPDVSFATLKLGELLRNYHPKSAIDIGTGTGYLAFVLRRIGTPIVYATDIHSPAIKCVIKNIKQNSEIVPIKVIHSDLFCKLISQFSVLSDFSIFH